MRANPGERATALLSNWVGGAQWGLGGALTRWPKNNEHCRRLCREQESNTNVEIVGLAVARVNHPDPLGSGRCGRGQSAPDPPAHGGVSIAETVLKMS
jgi:hypothetical protein